MTSMHWAIWLGVLAVQVLVGAVLLRTPQRQYRAIPAYLQVLLFTTVAGISVYMLPVWSDSGYAGYFWTAELLRQSSMMAIVLSFGVHSTPARFRPLLSATAAATAAFWTGSLALSQDPTLSVWIPDAVRNLSFCAVIANLVVWFILLARKPRDIARIVIAGGIGLQLAGDALGHSLLRMPIPQSVSDIAIGFAVATDLSCMVLCWIAFSRMNLAANSGLPVQDLPNAVN